MTGRIRERLFVLGVYLAGVLHWAHFLAWGRLTFAEADWWKERWYLEVLRRFADGENVIHVAPVRSPFAAVSGMGSRFFANPETILSPQIVLLRWLTAGHFIVAQILLLYTAGFVGLLVLRRRWALGAIPFSVMAVLTMANGYLTSHIAAGHTMWAACLLLPWFVHGVVERRPRLLAVVLAAMCAQGAVHLVVWCAAFLVIDGFTQRSWEYMARCLGLTAGLCAYRAIPAIMTYRIGAQEFHAGYGSLEALLEGMAVLHGPKYDAWTLHWWEWDCFIGIAGTAWVGWFGVPRTRELAVPLLLFTLLAMALPPIPILTTLERVPSRLIVLPLTFLIVLAAIGMQTWVNEGRDLGLPRKVGAIGAILGLNALSISTHSSLWMLSSGAEAPSSVALTTTSDPAYVASLVAGLVISLATALSLGPRVVTAVRSGAWRMLMAEPGAAAGGAGPPAR